jgi:hypothetical protein
VILEDDVELGANSTIDGRSIRDTVARAGAGIDNLVQIGHNVRLGRCSAIVAQAGIAGSTSRILSGSLTRLRYRVIGASGEAARSLHKPALFATCLLARRCWGLPPSHAMGSSPTLPH